MFACESYENELKLSFDYKIDYLDCICKHLNENQIFLKKLKTKTYEDFYYDTDRNLLKRKNCSYRLRINGGGKKFHVNFKFPVTYNQNGIICRKEIKTEFDRCDIPQKIDVVAFLMNYECKPNAHVKKLIEDASLHPQFSIQTSREYFQVAFKDVDLFGECNAFGVACIDHSKAIYNDRGIDINQQFEIEVWNNYADIGVWDRLNNISKLLQQEGFVVQTKPRYEQIFDL